MQEELLKIIIIALAVIWSLPWKGWALWRSARNGDRLWFIVILILNTLAILDILYIFIFSKKEKNNEPNPSLKRANPSKII